MNNSETYLFLLVQSMCQKADSLSLPPIAELYANMLLDLVLHIAHVIVLARALSQDQTNGVSVGGTLEAPTFPRFLTKNPLPDGFPWGNKTADNSNPYTEVPDTGVTRQYQFTISRAQKSPDGYLKTLLLVNDQFPGPTIEANWGDYIEGESPSQIAKERANLAQTADTSLVQVTNMISAPEEGTALHWHGLLQTATPWYDGVPSVQQCPVAPGAVFTYDPPFLL